MADQHVVREIPVKLTAEERAKLGETLAHFLVEREAVYGSKRLAVADHNSKIKILDKSIKRTTSAVETGSEMREIACILRPGITQGTIDIIIEATGELHDTITDDPALAENIAQQELPLVRPGKACLVCGMADGTHRDEPHGEGMDENNMRVDLSFAQLEAMKEAEAKGETINIEIDDEPVEVVSVHADFAAERAATAPTEPAPEGDDERDDGAAALEALGGEEGLEATAGNDEEDEAPAPKAKGKGKKKGGGK